MMPLRSSGFSLVAALLFGTAQSLLAENTQSTTVDTHETAPHLVNISGAVLQPGAYQWQPGTRLHDATVAGQVRADAWFLGAALLRNSALEAQQRLKAGVLFDLRVNKLHARADNNPPLLELVERLDAQVSSLPVTGRVTAELNPFQLLIAQNNQLLEPGDSLLYPTRPAQVRVLGAVVEDCELVFDAALALQDYLRQCPKHSAADRNAVYVIQPDGQMNQVGIAHWNKQQISMAVGAVIYRPLSAAQISPETPGLNTDMAALLATQYQLGGQFSE